MRWNASYSRALMLVPPSLPRTMPIKYTAAPMRLEIERCPSSAASSIGSVVMVSCRFIRRRRLTALNGREERHLIAFLQHAVAALIIEADGDQRGPLQASQLWEAGNHPSKEHLHCASRWQRFLEPGAAG